MRKTTRTKTILLLLMTGALLHAGAARADNFSAGDYIIPMDSTLQPYGLGTCAETDYGIFQAYGLVYKLLARGVTVYWIINSSPNRVGSYDVNYPDIALTGTAPLVQLHANSDTRGSTGLAGLTTVNYFGGPFVINVQNPTVKSTVDNVIAAWVADPANSKVNNCAVNKHVSIHVAKANFTAPVARVLKGAPPRIAVLGAGATGVLTGYIYLAGLGASTSGIYTEVTPEQIIAGALDKVGDAYPYQVLWAPHWTGTGTYTGNTWDAANLVYPGGAGGTVDTGLGNIVALSADNTTITTDDSASFGKLKVGDIVAFLNLDEAIVFTKNVSVINSGAKTLKFTTPITEGELSKIAGPKPFYIEIDESKSTTSVLKLNAWDAAIAEGMTVDITTKAPYTNLGTRTVTVIDPGNKKVTLSSPLAAVPPDKALFWYPKSVFFGSVHMWLGTTVSDDEVVKKVTAFLSGGNGLFAECASITVFEGSPYGRYLSSRLAGTKINLGGNANFSPNGLDSKSSVLSSAINPTSPYSQIGDFPYYPTGGHTHNWKAINGNGTLEPAGTYPGSAYFDNNSRLISLRDASQSKTGGPATWYNSGWDAAVGGRMWGQTNKGYVVYLGGHSYVSGSGSNANGTYSGIEPKAGADPNSNGLGGVAGIRIVLNTLLNLKNDLVAKEYVRSSPVATADSQLFLGSFEAPGYKGHFRSYNALASSADNAYTFYDAASRFPTADQRRLYYQNPSSNTFKAFTTANLYSDFPGAFSGLDNSSKREALVNQYRGKTAQVDPTTGNYKVVSGNLVYDETWKLGPILYSTPSIVGYSSNVDGGTTRPRVAYVVDGWGVLHAFYAPYMPGITSSWTTSDFAGAVAANSSLYTLSGTLNAGGVGNVTLTGLAPGAEIYGWVTDKNELNYLKDYGTWYTKGISASPKSADLMIDVGGGVMRYRTLLAIPQGEGTNSVPILDVTNPLQPTLKYILDNTISGYGNIGHSKTFAMGRVWVNDGSTTGLRNYLFYATESTQSGSPGITLAAVDLDAKTVAWRVTMPYDNTATPNDIPGGPSIVDADGDGIIDYVFAGDSAGRVWGLYASQTGRKDGSGNTIPGGASIYGTISSSPVPLANLGTAEPVAVVPTVYKEGNRLNVVFGTGGTDWAPSKDAGGADVYYHVYSYDAAKPVSSPSLGSGAATQQWTYTLPAGEKVFAGIVKAGPYLFLGTAYGTALNKVDPTADVPMYMSQSGHMIILQATGETASITREVANLQVGKIMAAPDIRNGRIYYSVMATDDASTGNQPTQVTLRSVTGMGSANGGLIGTQGGPGNRIEVLYWNEVK